MRVIVPLYPYGLVTDIKALRNLAKEHCSTEFHGKSVTNIDSQDQILMNNKGVKHTLHNAQLPLIESTFVLDQILIKAFKTGKVVDKLNRPDTPWVHLYSIQLDLASTQTVLDCSIVVKEDRQGILRYYDHSAIKK